MTKENIRKRLRNWKTWVALASLLGFICAKTGLLETKVLSMKCYRIFYTRCRFRNLE